jgi:soluble lytic murein transglycosylase-like protein
VLPARHAAAALAVSVLLGIPGRALAPVPVACAPALLDEEQPAPSAAERVLASHLSRRFMVAPQTAALVVAAAHQAAGDVGLDPLLVLAVIAVESSFNPLAESSMGAKGLMQIIPKYHQAKLSALGGDEAVLDPEANIHVGARILQEYVYRRGSLEAGLQYYNGASADSSAQYAQKVLAERRRLEQVVRAALRREAFEVADTAAD